MRGKTLLLRLIAMIVDPRAKIESLVQRLPRDEKDRRVNIFNNYVSYFDNETSLKNYEMDELCTWVTGYSGTVRVLHTTDESRTYSGKRPIGINRVNIPVVNYDILNRAFVIEMHKVADGSDGLSESELIPENEIVDNVRNLMPEILGHIFDIEVKTLRLYDSIRREIKPNHRLADFVILGEAISRSIQPRSIQPGFISTPLHRGIGDSSMFVNYAVRESTELFKKTLNNPESNSLLDKYPPSTIASPHLFEKVAVPGICVK
jgi:hypothetical protein